MRPYLAVIADSFRSALSSRVLWVAMIAIWLILALLAPLGFREDYTSTIRGMDFDNPTQLKVMLARGLVDPDQKETALGRLAQALPESLKRRLEKVGRDDVKIYLSTLADALNETLEDESWYDAEAWQKTVRLSELRDLDEMPREELSDALRRRRARLRIEAALPGVFEARPAQSILLTYAGFDFPAFFWVGRPQFVNITNTFVMPLLMNWLLGFALIFLGVLVTGSIVPDMLQPGSLHLLLSKPISRTLLLISKFIGGCAFVLLCVSQLVVGLWLILGLRLDLWNIRILWCIPVCVFLFAVYFSVSVFAGLRWRQSILAVGVTCVFGGVLLVISVIGGYFDAAVRQPARIRHVLSAGDSMIASTRGGELLRFSDQSQAWDKLIEGGMSARRDLILKPICLDDEHFVTARVRGGRFNPYGLGAPDLLILSEQNEWQPEPGLQLPIASRRLFALSDGSLLAMNTGGLMKADRGKVLDTTGGTNQSSLLNQIQSLMRMQGAAASDFVSVLPAGVSLAEPARVVVDEGDTVVLYSRGQLSRLARSDKANDPWELRSQKELERDASKPTILALSGSLLLLMQPDEPALLLDAKTFEIVKRFDECKDDSFLTAVGLGDTEQFIALDSDGRCRHIGRENITDRWGGFREVESIAWNRQQQQVLVAHHIDQVDVLDGKSFECVESIRPNATGWRMVDRYVITPLRTLTPQTGELADTVSALVAGKSSFVIGQDDPNSVDAARLRILRPVLSCSGFIVFMLFVSCTYFARKDF